MHDGNVTWPGLGRGGAQLLDILRQRPEVGMAHFCLAFAGRRLQEDDVLGDRVEKDGTVSVIPTNARTAGF